MSPANLARLSAGLAILACTESSGPSDRLAPTVTIDQAATQDDPTAARPVRFEVVFSENVTGFTASDVSFVGSSVGGVLLAAVAGSGANYTVTVGGMIGSGNVVLTIPPGAAKDQAGNRSHASTSSDNVVAYQDLPPSVTLNRDPIQANPVNRGPIVFNAIFSEPVTGLTGSDISFAGSSVGGTLVASVSGNGAAYAVSVTGMTGTGIVVVSLPPGSVVDAAGQANIGSTSTDNTVTFDDAPPGVTVEQAPGQADPTGQSPIEFAVDFSEPVSGFTGADVSFAGSTAGGLLAATVTGAGSSYIVSVTGMSGPGLVTISIPAGGVMDAAGNPNAASTSTDNSVLFQ